MKELILDDYQAYNAYPHKNWVYDKYKLLKELGYLVGEHFEQIPEKLNDNFVCLKPRQNLDGMGRGMTKVLVREITKIPDNFIWMEWFTGQHLSFDLLVYDGEICSKLVFRGYPSTEVISEFDYWEHLVDNPPELPREFQNLFQKYFSDFTGCLNLETIANKVIELHLRLGDSIFFSKVQNQVVKLLKSTNKKTKLSIKNFTLGQQYLIPLFVNINYLTPEIKNQFIQDYLESHYLKDFSFVLETEQASDEKKNRIRFLLILCQDLSHGLEIREQIKNDLFCQK